MTALKNPLLFSSNYFNIYRTGIKGRFLLVLFLVLQFFAFPIFAQPSDSLSASSELKKMSLEELMGLEVTSVSKRPEKLNEAASAIQVITQADIRNSGVKTLPEALRLASNLQVAQVNASQWAISARGFDNVLANKLLVLIDGRTVYTPLYAGVFWDVQNLVLEDIERIEVISGPGGTLWGANAVNGVINIITKSTKDTKGLFVEGAMGSNGTMPGLGSVRYGGRLSDNLTCRVYGTTFKMGSTLLTDGSDAQDSWMMRQGGIRLDWEASPKNSVAFQSNLYESSPNPDGVGGTPVYADGQNALAKWSGMVSEKVNFQLQGYYDHTWRDFQNNFTEDLKTYDMEGQARIQLGQRHSVTTGLNFRQMDHKVTNLPLFGFFPADTTLHIYSLFLQYDVMLIKEKLRFTLGTKVEHNTYTAFQHQPNVRLTWTPAKQQTLWAAVSRAVRNPSRIDRDFALYLAPNFPYIEGTDSFKSETVIAYELGWRTQLVKRLSTSLSTYYNTYDHLRSAEPGPSPFFIPITFANGVRGETYGMELSFNYQLAKWWSLRGGYTLLKKNLWVKDNTKDQNKGTAESNDPENQFLVQSNVTLPLGFEFGTIVRYVDLLPQPYVPDYMALDLRLGWKLFQRVELSIVGQNLLQDNHMEFIPSSPSPRLIQRSAYGKIIFRF